MKLLLRDYLASLKERDELDAILPDLLSELGYTILSRPQRGTQQRGVDIAAVGPDEDGERKVFLFSVKAGDLTRQDWDGTPQALRSSLDEILDVYIRNRVPERYSELKVVICLAFGGVVQEQVRDQLRGYTEKHTTDRISFDEWNGDKLAGFLLKGMLREKLVPRPMRSSFQKAVAMVDEPEASYQHFGAFVAALREAATASGRSRVRAARQLNLALWVLYVWARDVGNIEAAYRASELALLSVWEMIRPIMGRSGRDVEAMSMAVRQISDLHLNILGVLLEARVFPHVDVRHGLSSAVNSRSWVDVNLAMFEVLGRIGLAGNWLAWLGGVQQSQGGQAADAAVRYHVEKGFALIRNNPALLLPATDSQATDVALFLLAWLNSGLPGEAVAQWLTELAQRLDLTIRTRGRYPIVSSDYRDLADHPRDRSDEYFEECTAASTLIPLVAVWLHALGQREVVEQLAELARDKLEHCTMQLWMPDADTEKTFYVGAGEAGRALTDLPVAEGGQELIDVIVTACEDDSGLFSLSAVERDFWPIVLVACRHYRLPVPPGFWIDSMNNNSNGRGEADAGEAGTGQRE